MTYEEWKEERARILHGELPPRECTLEDIKYVFREQYEFEQMNKE